MKKIYMVALIAVFCTACSVRKHGTSRPPAALNPGGIALTHQLDSLRSELSSYRQEHRKELSGNVNDHIARLDQEILDKQDEIADAEARPVH